MPHGVSPCMQTVRGTEFHPVCRQSKEDAMPHGVSPCMQTVRGGCNATRSFIQYAVRGGCNH